MALSVWRKGRALNRPVLIEATLLGSTATLLLLKAANGTLAYYIHPRYVPLVLACAVVLLLVMVARLRLLTDQPSGTPGGRRAGYLLLALPLVVALAVPTQPLGANALTGTTFGAVRTTSIGGDDSRQWTLLQWVTAVNVRGDEVQGREVDAIGFVYHDPARPFEGFFLARLVIVCCVADGSGVSLPVAWPDGKALPLNSWVRVRGTLGTLTLGGRSERGVLATSVEAVPQPQSPYLYP